ncbi:cyclic AMP-responsive element-binding protein 3-like protein 4 [Corythoichthys intestinalis]|uniref:cyclic AMP-responsive element-binding protein 3-like protein 4 n=1 Tax=Corythoichthys intestinalis TaxID=161448 RepID=UPI0025A53F13|nr:cyclic AMP-responsive element-binding protein 3-like protein 4 [Corythoichthys intestinalis]XP_057689277.1 cyclic AMP-responsive element-binding protein 3-like protein 4 [Corythoichthys intestinalis]XP_061789057.1 cyclic AMP-responsive element-binding protein 3-like protein 4 [Nerophis lumbriciformis]
MDAESTCFHGLRQEVAAALPNGHLRESTLSDGESEDVLRVVEPNDIFGVGRPVCDDVTQPVFQVVYDLDGGEESQLAGADVIAVQLDPWSSHHFLSETRVVGEQECGDTLAQHVEGGGEALELTEEEEKLLIQEGVSLSDHLPLTKAEERVLKKVRRKIRNKRSAQDSRQRRKEYIDRLEDRAAACSVQNKDLRKKVEQLEKRNMSLLTQLRHLQSLVKHTVSKGAQTGTCLLIIFVSLSLILLPSLSPFSRRALADDYRPTGVLSRNILRDRASGETLPSDPPLPAKEADQTGTHVEEIQLKPEAFPSNAAAGNASSEASAGIAAELPHADEM